MDMVELNAQRQREVKTTNVDKEAVSKWDTLIKAKQDLLRNMGDHIHNMKILENQKGELLIARRGKIDVLDHKLYGPCPACHLWINKISTIMKHVPKWPAGKSGVASKANKGSLLFHRYVVAGRKGSLLFNSDIVAGENRTAAKKAYQCEIFPWMKRDRWTEVAQSHPLCLLLMEEWWHKGHSNPLRRCEYGSFHSRQIAMFLNTMRELTNHSDLKETTLEKTLN